MLTLIAKSLIQLIFAVLNTKTNRLTVITLILLAVIYLVLDYDRRRDRDTIDWDMLRCDSPDSESPAVVSFGCDTCL